jgi:predicted transcriptional regulator
LKTVEIVEALNHRSPGTIRNLMQTMKALGLVRGIAGPTGGYLPTELAFETLGFEQEAEDIPIYRNEKLSDVTFQEMRLRPPNSSILHVLGDIRDFKVGDKIKIASRKLIISGRVEGRNDLNNTLLSSIEVAFLIK